MKKNFALLFTITLLSCGNNAIGTASAENWKESKMKFGIAQIVNILKEFADSKQIELNYIRSFVEYYLVIFLQKASGDLLSEDDVVSAIEAYYRESKTLKQFKESHKNDDNKDYPYLFLIYHNTPFKKLYFDTIINGCFNTDKIINDYKFWTGSIDTRSSFQILRQEWFELSDDQFKKHYECVRNEFADNKFLTCKEILEIASLQFEFSKYGLINEKIDDVKNRMIEYINKNKNQITIYKEYLSDTFINNTDGYEKEIAELSDLLRKNNIQIRISESKNRFVELYQTLPKSVNELSDFISKYNATNLNVAILEQIDIGDFYKYLVKLSYDNAFSIYSAFDIRYEKCYSGGKLKTEYYSDIDKIKLISEKYKESVGDNVFMSPTKLTFKFLSERYKELYEYMISKTEKKTT